MALLIAGLLLFLGMHFTGILANDWRQSMIEKRGAGTWKVLYSAVSIVGFILIVIGYGAARTDPVFLWAAPVWARHLAMPLTLIAFILLAATYVPQNRIKARLGHPMLAAVKIWALAHLLANGTLADVLLFGSFLIWAIVGFAVLRRRDRHNGVTRSGTLKGDIITGVTGVVAWAVFAMFLHTALIGVSPLP
ncbi:MAG: NnrU family protein [Gammaproteobacteria bacterium]|nr:NnrU family protein [Gammaproteobacteria bacterium]MBC55119.1 NnrU family protein [Gammaproteobacteria bacterium]